MEMAEMLWHNLDPSSLFQKPNCRELLGASSGVAVTPKAI
jgi:hypothetical protein